MTPASLREFDALRKMAKAADRKAKRLKNASFQAAAMALNGSEMPKVARKLRKGPGRPRKYRRPLQRALMELEAICKIEAKQRSKAISGACRICLEKQNLGWSVTILPANCWYHYFPRGDYSAIKYNPLNYVWACSSCNAGEHWHRQKYQELHKSILGPTIYEMLDSKRHDIAKLDLLQVQEMISAMKARIEAA